MGAVQWLPRNSLEIHFQMTFCSVVKMKDERGTDTGALFPLYTIADRYKRSKTWTRLDWGIATVIQVNLDSPKTGSPGTIFLK